MFFGRECWVRFHRTVNCCCRESKVTQREPIAISCVGAKFGAMWSRSLASIFEPRSSWDNEKRLKHENTKKQWSARLTMDTHKCLGTSMEIHGWEWNSFDIHGYPEEGIHGSWNESLATKLLTFYISPFWIKGENPNLMKMTCIFRGDGLTSLFWLC